LRDGQRDLARLTSEAQRLMLEQDQLEQTLQGIGAFQYELEKTLEQVEDNVDKIFQSHSHLSYHDADREREKAYNTAKAVDLRLDDVLDSLQTTFSLLTAANQQSFSGETAEVVTILNQHQDNLVDLEAAAHKLDLDCKEVNRMLQSSRH